ncbi:MAG: GNAT family N-acetyltransferase [Chloroflexota bacterium]
MDSNALVGMMNDSAIDTMELSGEPIGLFYTWWRGDEMPELPTPHGLSIERTHDSDLIHRVTALEPDEADRRLRQENAAFLAWIDGEVVGYGWSAAGRLSIGELGIDCTLPEGNRYLWDFITQPQWRGRNIYPALLRAILRKESGAVRFWVGHDFGNSASARGILKAGFQTVGEVYATDGTGPVYVRTSGVPLERALAGAELLDMPFYDPVSEEI